MKILITGAKGQLGHDCTIVLGASNTVHGFSSKDMDISDQDQVKHHLQLIKPDVVVNCAAYTAVDGCEAEQEKCWLVNKEGAAIVASACAHSNVRLVHISTDYVFDGTKQVPETYIESDPVRPLSQYGASKLAGEEQIRDRLENHLILRTSWLYGISGHNFLKTMLRLAMNNPQQTIRVVNDQYGSLTWTHRLALQIQTLLESDITGTFHATATGYCSWYDVAKLFLETMQVSFILKPCTTEEYPTPAKRPVNSILKNNKLEKYGLNRMVSWEDDMVTFANQFRAELLAEVAAEK